MLKPKSKLILKEFAAWLAFMLLISLAGNLSYEDEVLQGQSNCENAAYAYDNQQLCEGE